MRKLLLISYRVALKRKDNAKRPIYDRKWSRHTGSPEGKREQEKESQLIWYLQKYNAEEPDKHLILDLAGMLPAVETEFDGMNVSWYLAEGDYGKILKFILIFCGYNLYKYRNKHNRASMTE